MKTKYLSASEFEIKMNEIKNMKIMAKLVYSPIFILNSFVFHFKRTWSKNSRTSEEGHTNEGNGCSSSSEECSSLSVKWCIWCYWLLDVERVSLPGSWLDFKL
jgi:hypothetical protein